MQEEARATTFFFLDGGRGRGVLRMLDNQGGCQNEWTEAKLVLAVSTNSSRSTFAGSQPPQYFPWNL